MIAKTFQGLEEILAKELTNLGANGIEIGNRMVSFRGDKALLYKANFHLRTALRILKPFHHFKADSADQVYEICKSIDWEKYMTLTDSFAVDAVVNSENFRHSKFVAYRVKDAIADHFREKYGKRPNVSVANPDLTFHIHISNEDCSLSLDSSGESLHKRGYKQAATEAPINEVLAAGMILMSGWEGQCDFIDPMCGSGTIAIEAALIALNMAPGLFRSQFAFEKWNDFDADLFESIYNDDSQERNFNHRIIARDKDPKAIAIAKTNAKAAGIQDYIDFTVADFKDFEPVTEHSVLITNPPYGERLNDENLMEIYQMMGERFKHALSGSEAWVISYHYECFDKIGLKPSAKIPLFNGALACELRKYEMFSGRYSEFRQDGESLDKKEPVSRRSSTLKHKAREAEKLQAMAEGMDSNDEMESHSKPFRKPFREGGERKPQRRDSENSSFRRNDRPGFGDRKSFVERQSSGERSERRSFGERSERKPRGERSFGEKKSFGEGRKPYRNSDGGKSFGERSERRSFGERSDRKPRGERSFSGERNSRGGGKSFKGKGFRKE